MKKLLIAAIAAMALAVPTTASADVFTHEGSPIEGGPISVEFSGPVTTTTESGFVGHCEEVHIGVDFEAEGQATTTKFESTGCTTTNPGGLEMDIIPIDKDKWEYMPDAKNKIMRITKYHVTRTYTLNKVCVGEVTVKGTLVYEIKDPKKIDTGTVSSEGMKAGEVPEEVSGHLVLTSETEVGFEE
jgi:hypothetical protein